MEYLQGIGHYGEPLLMTTDKETKEDIMIDWISKYPLLADIKKIGETEYLNLSKTINLTREQAYESMEKGHKICHKTFFTNGYLYMQDGKMFHGEGDRCEDFWKERNGDAWQNGWCIVY